MRKIVKILSVLAVLTALSSAFAERVTVVPYAKGMNGYVQLFDKEKNERTAFPSFWTFNAVGPLFCAQSARCWYIADNPEYLSVVGGEVCIVFLISTTKAFKRCIPHKPSSLPPKPTTP